LNTFTPTASGKPEFDNFTQLYKIIQIISLYTLNASLCPCWLVVHPTYSIQMPFSIKEKFGEVITHSHLRPKPASGPPLYHSIHDRKPAVVPAQSPPVLLAQIASRSYTPNPSAISLLGCINIDCAFTPSSDDHAENFKCYNNHQSDNEVSLGSPEILVSSSPILDTSMEPDGAGS
jgi:hypothetical protein